MLRRLMVRSTTAAEARRRQRLEVLIVGANGRLMSAACVVSVRVALVPLVV